MRLIKDLLLFPILLFWLAPEFLILALAAVVILSVVGD